MAEPASSAGRPLWTSRSAAALAAVTVGFGWQASPGTDLDASAFGCDPDSRVLADEWFVFFNNLASPDRSIVHRGDGSADGDRARFELALDTMTGDVDRIVFALSIYDAESNGQSFDRVRDAYVRVVNRTDGSDLARYELAHDLAGATGVVVGELFRNEGEWAFRAIGQGYASGLAGIAREHGVDV